MAISVTWGTKVINVPKADMTLVQSSPTEIRELDLNTFRLTLKDLEDGEDGMPFPDTHQHSPPVTVGGVTLARVVEIINDYTVTFEDGQYAVNLVGANSNVGDRVNVNQVSVRSANSAGLVTSAAIEYGEYREGVTIDVVNGSSGSVYPIGTLRSPSNNVPDALVIAASRGFKKIYVLGDLTLDAGQNVSNFDIQGESHVNTQLTINSGAVCTDLSVHECDVNGVLDGGTTLHGCMVGDITYLNGHMHDCGLYGTVNLDGDKDAVINNCHTPIQSSPPTIDMNVSGQSLALSNYTGLMTITNFNSDIDDIGVSLQGGLLILDSTVTNGNVIVTGTGLLYDYSTGTTVNTDGLMSKATIAGAVFDQTEELKYRVETLKRGSGRHGTSIYWSPYGGDDTSTGLIRTQAVKTFSKAISLCEDGRGDTIWGIASNPSGPTVIEEQVVIDKSSVSLISSGRDFQFIPSGTVGNTIEIASSDVELRGIVVECASGNIDGFGIYTSGNSGFSLKDMWIRNCYHGIHIEDGEDFILDDVKIHHNLDIGIQMTGYIYHATVIDCHIGSNGSDGVEINLNSQGHEVNFIGSKSMIHGNGAYGVHIINNSNAVHITQDVRMFNNASGNVYDAGNKTYIEEDSKRTGEITKLQYLLEAQNEGQSVVGDAWYWSPYRGNDDLDGKSPEKAVATFERAHNLASPGDVIFGLSEDPSGFTTYSGNISITKRNLSVIGTGENFIITAQSGSVVHIESDYIAFEKFKVLGAGVHTHTEQGIKVINSDFFTLRNLSIQDGNDDGIHIENCTRGRLENLDIKSCEHYGLHFYNSSYCEMYGRNIIHYNGYGEGSGDGIIVEGTAHGLHIHTGTEVHGNKRYGINLMAGTQETFVHPDTRVFSNGTDNINDEGFENIIGDTLGFQRVDALKYSVESLRHMLPGYGSTWFVDPISGSDSNDGRKYNRSLKTIQAAIDKAGDGTHDVIYVIDTTTDPYIEIDEQLTINKKDLAIRSVGTDMRLKPSATTGYTIDVQAEEFSLEKMRLECAASGTASCLNINAGGCMIDRVKVAHSRDIGIIVNGDGTHIRDCIVEHHTNERGIGILVTGNSHEVEIESCNVYDANTGIYFSGTTYENAIRDTIIHDNTTGIYVDSGVAHTYIFGNVLLSHNGDDVINSGSGTYWKEEEDNIKINNLRFLLETGMETHSRTGNVWYWAPGTGNDTYHGKTPEKAVKTFTKAHELVVNNNSDTIIILATSGSGTTYINEKISVTKSRMSLQGHGKEIKFTPSTPDGNTVEILGDNIALDNFDISMEASSTSGYGVYISGTNCLMENIEMSECYNALRLNGGEHSVLKNIAIHHNTNDGIEIYGPCNHTDIMTCHIGSNGGDGVVIDLEAGYHEVNILNGTIIHGNSGYGVNILNSSDATHISKTSVIFNNTLGNINDEGVNTYNELINYVTYSVYIDTGLANTGNGSQHSPFNNLSTAIDFAEANGINNLIVFSDIVLDRQLKNFAITGVGIPTIDCNGQNIDRTEFNHCRLQGTYTGEITAQECALLNGLYLNGFFQNCGLGGALHCIDGANVLVKDCSSLIPGLAGPSISMNGSGTVQLSVTNYTGTLTVTDCNTPGDNTTVDMAQGALTFDATCIDGTMVARGLCTFTDNTTGSTVVDETTSRDNIASTTWESSTLVHQTPDTFGNELATKSDVKASASTNESAAGSGTIIFGTSQSGDYTSTLVHDETYWQIGEDATNGITVEFTFNLPSADHKAGDITVTGRYTGQPAGTHYQELWAYNYEASSWEKLKEMFMPGGITSDDTYSETYASRHIDQLNNNEVKVRIIHNATTYNAAHSLYIDQIYATSIKLVTAAEITESVWSKMYTDESVVSGSIEEHMWRIRNNRI